MSERWLTARQTKAAWVGGIWAFVVFALFLVWIVAFGGDANAAAWSLVSGIVSASMGPSLWLSAPFVVTTFYRDSPLAPLRLGSFVEPGSTQAHAILFAFRLGAVVVSASGIGLLTRAASM